MARLPESISGFLERSYRDFQLELRDQIDREGPLSMTMRQTELLHALHSKIAHLLQIDVGGSFHTDYQWLSELVVIADLANRLSEYLSDRSRFRSMVMPRAFDLSVLGFAPLPVGTPLSDISKAIAIVAESTASRAILSNPLDKFIVEQRVETVILDEFQGDPEPPILRVNDKNAVQRFPSPHREFILLRNAISVALDASPTLHRTREYFDHLNDFMWEAFEERHTPSFPHRLFAVSNEATQIRNMRGLKDALGRARIEINATRARTVSEALEVISDLAVNAGAAGGSFRTNSEAVVSEEDILSVDNINRIIRSVPEQQIAPVRFGYEAEKLVVLHTIATPEMQDENLVASVYKSVIKSGERLLSELPNSQCDRRFLAQIKELHEDVQENADIVYIGMQGQECQIAAKAFHEEFSPYFLGLLTSYFTSILDYVAQFPEWQRFLEQSVSAKILEAELVGQLRNVLANLQTVVAVPELVEPKVREKLYWLSKIIGDDRPLTKKTVMAVALSLHNMASAVLKWTTSLATQTAEKTQQYLAKAAALALVGSIGAAFWQFIPISNLIARTPWLEPALQWLKNAIPLIK